MPPHPLNNLEMQKDYQNQPKFNGVYSRKDLCNVSWWVWSNGNSLDSIICECQK